MAPQKLKWELLRRNQVGNDTNERDIKTRPPEIYQTALVYPVSPGFFPVITQHVAVFCYARNTLNH